MKQIMVPKFLFLEKGKFKVDSPVHVLDDLLNLTDPISCPNAALATPFSTYSCGQKGRQKTREKLGLSGTGTLLHVEGNTNL